MNNNQFLDLLYSNLTSYFFILAAILITYYFIFGRKIKHIADPLMIGFIAQVFSCSVVLFLYYNDDLNYEYFYSFLFTEFSFLLPLMFMQHNYIKRCTGVDDNDSMNREWHTSYSVFYYVTMFLFVVTSLDYFASAGIPILNQMSRLDTSESLGMLSWFTDVYWVCFPAMVIIKRFVYLRKSKVDHIMIFLCFLCLLAKGGKSDFFFMIVSLFLVKEVFQVKELKKIVKILSYISPFLIIGLMLILFSVWNSNANVFSAFFERFVLFGDVFYQGYNKSFMASLPANIYPWDYFFGGTINRVREMFGFQTNEKIVFGYEIAKYYYHIDSGIGPNARQNILGLYLFGPYLSVFFSFFLGLVYLGIRSGFGLITKKTSRYSLRMFFYIVFCTYSCFIFVDPSLALGLYLKILVVFSIPLFLSLLNASLCKALVKKKKNIESNDTIEGNNVIK